MLLSIAAAIVSDGVIVVVGRGQLAGFTPFDRRVAAAACLVVRLSVGWPCEREREREREGERERRKEGRKEGRKKGACCSVFCNRCCCERRLVSTVRLMVVYKCQSSFSSLFLYIVVVVM